MGRQLISTTLMTLLLCLMTEALPRVAWAQTGKLAGTVIDASTNEPLPGVTVVIDNTTRGTTTDVEGRYVIIGLTPGAYSVRYSYVGYSPQLIEGIQVTSDRTTTRDVALSTEVVA